MVDGLSPHFWMTSLQSSCQVSIKKIHVHGHMGAYAFKEKSIGVGGEWAEAHAF